MRHTLRTTRYIIHYMDYTLASPPFGLCLQSIPEEDIMTMDLIMEPSKPMKSKNFQWWCKEGIVANLDKAPVRSSPHAGAV